MKSPPGEPEGESEGALHEVGPPHAADSTPDTRDERGPGSALYHPKVATALWILALIALVAVLHLARAFFVPLLFGILVSYTLGPIVDWFERYHVPRAIASALVLGALVGGTSWMALSLSADTEAIVERLPKLPESDRICTICYPAAHRRWSGFGKPPLSWKMRLLTPA